MAPSRVTRQLLGIVHAYDREPEASGPDEATSRDLEYFDRIMEVLRAAHDEASAPRAAGARMAAGRREYRVRWAIELSARSALDAAGRAREVQLQADSLSTLFEVLPLNRRSSTLDWSRAETIDLTAVLRDRIAQGRR